MGHVSKYSFKNAERVPECILLGNRILIEGAITEGIVVLILAKRKWEVIITVQSYFENSTQKWPVTFMCGKLG